MPFNINKLFDLFTKKQKINFFVLIILSLINIFLEIISIGLLIPLLSSFTGDKSFFKDSFEKFGINVDFINQVSFEQIILTLLAVYILKFVFLLFFAYFKNNFFFSFQLDLIDRLFCEYVKRSYIFHVYSNSAKIIKDFLEEVHHVSIGFMGSILSVIIETLLITSLLTFLLFVQTQYTIFVLIITAIISFLVFIILKNKISSLGLKREKYNLINLKNINQALGGIKEVKIFRKENEVINNFKTNSQNLKNTNWFISFYNETPRIFFELISLCSFLIILFAFVKLDFSFVEIISYFVIIFAIFIRIMPSINKLIVSYVNITINKRATDVLHKELIQNDNKLELNLNNNNSKEIKFNNEIIIDNLSFKYSSNNEQVLNKINLNIQKGEIFGIIGQTGSGKSTLIDLLIGLLDPTNGKILVDGIDIKENKLNWFEKIGYVPQNMYLNDDSIKKNIAFTYDENKIDNEKVIDSAKKAKITDLIYNREDKLEARVGERGNLLSGGQKQRLGLARALYQNTSEILVLDEFTSALDKETEEEIMQEIINFRKNKTIIMSTHKQNLLNYCDKIYDIEKNKLINNS